jgi:hypothetical protein
MRIVSVLGLALLILAGPCERPARAQAVGAAPLRLDWEVKNRFRLFRSERDFQRQVAAYRNDGVLGAEERLARDSDGRGWARDTVERLCVDRAGKIMELCDREGAREVYLAPRDHPVGVVLAGPVPASVSCAWSFDDGEGEPRTANVPCDEEVKLRVAYGRPTVASVDIVLPDNTAQRVVTEIVVRDVLIAGLGDSIAAGDGNPDRPVRLAAGGFCFRRFLGGGPSEYYRPSRDGFTGNKSCVFDPGENSGADDWARQAARWESGPCHRSLYSYQMRTALAIAIENPRLAVTFLPLACTGATIARGLLASQPSRECPGGAAACSGTTRAQIDELADLMTKAHRHRADRSLDLVLLTVGANDIQFSGLVADIIIQATTERLLFGRSNHIATVADAQQILDRRLPGDFVRLRSALKPLVGGNLSRVVFASYGHPALAAPGIPCPGGRDGFDVHPAFGADGTRLRQVADFVTVQFLPKIRALALCEGGGTLCRDPASERMTFADAHQIAFVGHGFCARAGFDPPFDRECFSPDGNTFDSNPATAATAPLACGRAASDYRPYASRARWVRTANDSYFTAMTYPQGVSALQPTNIHDATWGVLSAVYGGAIHPTAQGHAAMADGTLPKVREVLGLAGAPAAASPAPSTTPGDGGAPQGSPTR